MESRNRLVFVICISFIVFAICCFTQTGRTTYEFSPKMSLAFFGRDPEGFLNTDYDFYDTCEDFRKHAKINKKGNLVLRLTKEQEEAFLQSCDSDLEEFERIKGVHISNDYTLLLVSGNKEEVTDIIANQMPLYAVFDMANRQLVIKKINPEEITVEFRVVDENTGLCVYNAIWPQDSVSLSPKEWDFCR